MCYDFIAIDFETATKRSDSACSIGIAAVQNGEIVDTFYSLIQPPDLNFNAENIEINGITPDMVKESPTLDDLWRSELHHFFGSYLVIAHNAYFDMCVLKQSIHRYDVPDFKYVDSISIARDYVPGRKSLEACAEYLGLDMGHHHNALDDAITCAKIVLKCLDFSGLNNIGQFCFLKENVKINHFSELNPLETYQVRRKSKSQYKPNQYVSAKNIIPKTTKFDDSHPLYQKYVLFSGNFSASRSYLMQAVANVGGIPKDAISRKIDYLVLGEPNPDFVDENGMSRKERAARELNESGKGHIKIITEAVFLSFFTETNL